MVFEEFIAIFVIFLLFVFLFLLALLDLKKQWQRHKRDELRRDSFIRSVQTISEYCYYKGLSEGFDMSSNQE